MKNSNNAAMIPNIFELGEAPFLKKEGFALQKFKGKETYVANIRNLTYLSSPVISKIYVFGMSELRKQKKRMKYLQVITEKEIITIEQLYQLLNENSSQHDFSAEVQKIKEHQFRIYNYVDSYLNKQLIQFNGHNYLNFNVYFKGNQFYVKASFKDYHFHFKYQTSGEKVGQPPAEYHISNYLVKVQLMKKYEQLRQLSESIPAKQEINNFYKQFYDDSYFHYDQFILKLQVLHNYPLLRVKNYLPIKFIDSITSQPLEGPIFSNSHPQCMYGHFSGYNADSMKMVEGQPCERCQIAIVEFQQNELLIMLRDNVLNPMKCDLFYCPEHNRFKLWTQRKVTMSEGEGGMQEETQFVKTQMSYLNYYHFMVNIRKMSNKLRVGFNTIEQEQSFSLAFRYLNRNMLIMDPAKGKYCQHYAFTDLRLYYLNYDRDNNCYKCPIEGCSQTMIDSDIIYLKEVLVLLEYVRMKCEQDFDLLDCSKVILNHDSRSMFVGYKVRENGNVMSKVDQIPKFYETLADPYVPFPEYTLGTREKKQKQFKQKCMFGGLHEEMQQEDEIEEEDDEY